MEDYKEDTFDQDNDSIGSFDDDFEDLSNLPVVAIGKRFGGHLNFAEEGTAKDLFFEMTCTCAKALYEFNVSTLCFNRQWFIEVFKESPHFTCCLTYSACQPLLSKYSVLFEKMMNALSLKVMDAENLDMLQISFEPEEDFWFRANEE